MSTKIEDIKRRAQKLRLPNKRLAELAGLDETTVGRTFLQDTIPLLTTLQKIEAALAREEAEMLSYLQSRRVDAA